MQSNKLYVNITAIQSTIFNVDGTKVDWVSSSATYVASGSVNLLGQLSTPGAAVLRDMGKSVYLPAVAGASQSTILRKVQLIPAGGVGTGAPAGNASGSGLAGAANEYFTGYISLGGQTFGGGNGVPSGVARLN